AVFLAGTTVVQYQVTTTATAPALLITPATGTTLYGSASTPAVLGSIIRGSSPASYFAKDHATKVGRPLDSATPLNPSFGNAAVTGIGAAPTYTNPITNATETNLLALQLRQVARLIAAATTPGANLPVRRQVFFVSLGGWDTHDFQNTTQPNLLAKVAQALS